tara:strand:+ start:122 stop:439 length:318 start_codon:yes stop_codon:yes gene_type:complete
MKPSTNYEKFIADDFSLIQDCFEEQGYSITNATDFSTYQGWIDKGRKVKCGEKAIVIETTNAYAQPVFLNGTRVYDEISGKKQFRRYRKSFALFHKNQTKCLLDK